MTKQRLLFVGLFLLTTLLVKAENIRYCSVKQSDYSRVSLTFNAGNLSVHDLKTPEGMFSLLAIDGFYPSSDVGNPNLPVLSQTIEIPLCKGVSYRVVNSKTEVYTAAQLGINYTVYPAQPSYSKSEEGPFPLVKNSETYSLNEFYGADVIRIEEVGVARNINLANVYFSPIKYNPVTNEISIVKELEVEIVFEDADVAATRKMKKLHSSPAFSVKADIANVLEKDTYTTGPLKYLIVSHSSFKGQFDEFVAWKRRKGFLVDIAYTDDVNVGTTASSIQAYIKSQYTNATPENPAPTYVLLVGDVQQIPPFDSRISSSWLNDHITDLYYFTWTDGDIIPDCYYGRFSAQTVAHLTPQIEKTLMYEKYLMDDPSYLDKALIIAGVDGGQRGDHGYTHADPVIHYLEDNYVNATYGYTTVTSYYNPNSGTSAAETGVYNALSGGVGFANYTAHCNYSNWSTPEFNTSDVARMQNTQKFGLMIGNCCLSNKFDVSACLGEALLRKDNYCGAVGYIGGSNSTYWDQDYWWAVGVRTINTSTCPTPTYDASKLGVYDRLFHTHNESYSDWYTSNGAIIMAGNMAVQSSSTSTSYKTYYWEIYHLMGDPSVMSYLTQAQVMEVNVNTTLFNDAQSLSVQAVPHAYVALTDNNGGLVAATFADANGEATLSFEPLNTIGTFELAVSAQNYQMSFTEINVIAPNGPFVLVENAWTATGNNVNVGDDARITFEISNVGVESAENVWVEINSADNQKIVLYDTMLNVGNMQVGAKDTLYASAHIFSNVPNGDRLTVNVTIHFDDNKTTLYNYRLTATGYEIYKVDEDIDNITTTQRSYILPGDTILLSVKYKNTGAIVFRNLQNNVYSANPLVTITNPRPNITLLPTDGQIEVEYTIALSQALQQSVVIPIYNTMTNGTYTYRDTIMISLKGLVEDFETGDFAKYPWNNTDANPWEIAVDDKKEGQYSMKSKTNLDHSSTSKISITWTSSVDDSISYFRKVSSEGNYDKFYFKIDDVEMENVSGEKGWERAAFYVSAGTHTFTFEYTKDYSISNGSNCVWIDYLELPLNSSDTYTYVVDTICQGSVFENGNLNVNTAELQPGTYYYADSTSTNTTTYLMLTVVSAPSVQITGNTEIQSGQSTKLTAMGASQYLWNNGETVSVMNVMPTATTRYTVVGYAKGCPSDTASVVVKVDGIGIVQSQNTANISIYPNPADKYVMVEGDVEMKNITVFNMAGQMVDMIDVAGSKWHKCNVEKYESGSYVMLINLINGQTKRMHLLVVE